jgi:hypothetical protein
LAAGQGSAAAAESQKILDHSGIVWNCWTGTLTRPAWQVPMFCKRKPRRARMPMRLASACSRLQRLSRAVEDSDPDILKEAKAEYAKLQ